MVYQDRLETNLLQLFAYPENSEWFSISFLLLYLVEIIIHIIIFDVNIVAEQKFVNDFSFVLVSIALNYFTDPHALQVPRCTVHHSLLLVTCAVFTRRISLWLCFDCGFSLAESSSILLLYCGLSGLACAVV